jgi:Co/Zn/Cd efflux system component
MSSHCHDNCDAPFDGSSPAYKRALWVVIGINLAMFIVEMAAGALAGSKALQADALDFAADTMTYSLTLAAIGWSLAAKTRVALLKGLSLAAMGVWVLGSTIYQTFILGVPEAEVMGVIGALALTANVVSALILLRYKDGDANVRSVWLCTRNDAIGNVAVMAAAGAVFITQSAWPDLIVAAAMAALFLSSSFSIIRQALTEAKGNAANGVPAQ